MTNEESLSYGISFSQVVKSSALTIHFTPTTLKSTLQQRFLVSKRLHAMEYFTKVRIFLISHSIIFLNAEIKDFLFQRKLAKRGEQNVQKIVGNF